MNHFIVDPAQLDNTASQLSIVVGNLNDVKNSVGSVSSRLTGSNNMISSTRLRIARAKKDLSDASRAANELRIQLSRISELYRQTESRIVSNGSGAAEQNKDTGSRGGTIPPASNFLMQLIRRYLLMLLNWDNRGDTPDVDQIVFDEDNDGYYGGDQGSARYDSYERRQEYYDIIRDNIPELRDADDRQLQNYLEKLNSEGCGYVALANTVFVEYQGRPEEFEETFGYPMYIEDQDGNRQYNYNSLIVDIYSSTDNRDSEGYYDLLADYSEDADGSINSYNEWNDPSGNGSSRYSRDDYLENFLADHGVQVEVENDVHVTPENYQEIVDSGKQISVDYYNGNLYNMDGTIAQPIEGGHSMTVTGVTEDGKFIVSSWGGQYYIDPNEQGGSIFYDNEWHETDMSFITYEY